MFQSVQDGLYAQPVLFVLLDHWTSNKSWLNTLGWTFMVVIMSWLKVHFTWGEEIFIQAAKQSRLFWDNSTHLFSDCWLFQKLKWLSVIHLGFHISIENVESISLFYSDQLSLLSEREKAVHVSPDEPRRHRIASARTFSDDSVSKIPETQSTRLQEKIQQKHH